MNEFEISIKYEKKHLSVRLEICGLNLKSMVITHSYG